MERANTVRNAGNDAGITSLKVRGDFVYGTTWHFGAGGNLEGTFKASAGSGDVEWVTDCHGDNYSTFPSNGVVYSVGHAHYCGNMGGGFPQYSAWRYQHTQAWSDAAGGEILNDVHGYTNWHGRRAGAVDDQLAAGDGHRLVHRPDQAGWDVTGNADYVVVGGEFPRVNGVNQQGLVRFARRSLLAPQQRQQGPRFLNNEIVPTLVPTSPTSVRVSWLAGFDRDDLALQYEVFRVGVTPARYTTTANSNWWTMPFARVRRHGAHAGPDLQLPDRRPRLRQPRRQRRHEERHDALVCPHQRLRQPGARRWSPPVLAAERAGLADAGADHRHRPGRRLRWSFRQRRDVGSSRGDHRRYGGPPHDDERVEPHLHPRHRDRARRVLGPGVDQDDDHHGRAHPRLRRSADRKLRAPRSAHLHEQRRTADLRRSGPGQLGAHADERAGLQRQPVAPGDRHDGRRRDAPLRRRGPGRQPHRHDPGRGVPRLLARRWRQPRRMARCPGERELRERLRRRGRHLPDGAQPGPDRRSI